MCLDQLSCQFKECILELDYFQLLQIDGVVAKIKIRQGLGLFFHNSNFQLQR